MRNSSGRRERLSQRPNADHHLFGIERRRPETVVICFPPYILDGSAASTVHVSTRGERSLRPTVVPFLWWRSGASSSPTLATPPSLEGALPESTASADLNGLCHRFGHRKILRMDFFQLHHPLNATVLCDRKGCEQVADYLEVDDHGHEYRLCASHTDSKTHSSRLPTRKPSPDLPFRSRPAAWTVGGTRAPSEL